MTLEEFRKLVDAATPGPLGISTRFGKMFHVFSYNEQFSKADGKYFASTKESRENAEFIVACRNMAPKLLAVAEAAVEFMESRDCGDGTGPTRQMIKIHDAVKALEQS